MWNPFKKKEKGFKLDEEQLPSLSEVNSSDLKKEENNEEKNSLPPLNSSNMSISNENQNNVELSLHNTGFENDSLNNNPFNSNADTGLTENFSQQIVPNSNLPNSQNNFNSNLSKVKFETIEAKITLIEARLSNIEQKLEVLFRLVYEEVSEETKRKLKLDSILNK